ncbi:SDR family oxidoreductase [Rhodanobacter glycinis]|uniref:SDR family oxidoreductase n=1 Tax=Rhodanobacter glycinis TaxID=582702 RepID=A0A5B9DZG9_9GAMM|nr:SDR family oxidoreductase [Rhodanobacter glycinis]QEE23356.1 SDR family oxidoreductase [Rhodanobacter glycinis]
MSKRMQSKVALVTGGASGVGLATAWLLAREGARVAITDINTEAGQALAAEINTELGDERAMFLRHNVSNESDWIAVIAAVQEHLGPLDILINNAGILLAGDIAHATLAQFQATMQVNAASCFLGCKHGVAAMKQRGGAIVNMASIASWLPVEGYAAYGASKAAVAALTRSTALHCRKQGLDIRVNSLHPDGVYTPMMQAALPPGVPSQAVLFDPRKNPAGRATMPEHIARVLLFLAGDDARAISGAEIHADSAILGMGL